MAHAPWLVVRPVHCSWPPIPWSSCPDRLSDGDADERGAEARDDAGGGVEDGVEAGVVFDEPDGFEAEGGVGGQRATQAGAEQRGEAAGYGAGVGAAGQDAEDQ